MKFIYLARKATAGNNTTIAGVITARHSFEALHNARIEATLRGAEARYIKLDKIAH